jgi:hypothetical protein
MSRRETVAVAITRADETSEHAVPMDATVAVPGHGSSSIREFSAAVIDESPIGQRPGDYVVAMQPDETLSVSFDDKIYQTSKVEITCRVRSFESVANLSLAGGHVLADPTSGDIRYRGLVSNSWDMHQLLSAPPTGELTGETFDQVVAQGTPLASVDPRTLKRYLRVVLRDERGDPKS